MAWLVIISVFVLGEVPQLISGFIVSWQVVHPEEGLLLGEVSVSCHKDVISSDLLESKVIAKSLQREWFRAKTDTK
jgi:hypothetical protein